MTKVEVDSKHFRSLCTVLGYRRRKIRVVATQSVTLHGLNWDSGSKNTYHSADLSTDEIKTHSSFGNPHPWFNEREGAKVALPENIIVIRTGVFLGKEAMMEIYVHPNNMPKLIGEANVG